MDILAVGLSNDTRTSPQRPRRQTSRHLRRTKLVTAFALTALIGVGSYAVTYRALILVSTPSSPTVSIAPASSGGTPTVPTAVPAHP